MGAEGNRTSESGSRSLQDEELQCIVNTFGEAISRAAPDSGHTRALLLRERAASRAVLHALSLGAHESLSCQPRGLQCKSASCVFKRYSSMSGSKTREAVPEVSFGWQRTSLMSLSRARRRPSPKRLCRGWGFCCCRLSDHADSAGGSLSSFPGISTARHPTSA